MANLVAKSRTTARRAKVHKLESTTITDTVVHATLYAPLPEIQTTCGHTSGHTGVCCGSVWSKLPTETNSSGSVELQIHLVPRPGKAKVGEEVQVFEASSKFSFHQINAWESGDGTVAKDFQSFKVDMENLPVSIFERPELLTSVRRLVLQPKSGRCREYDLRGTDLLRWRDVELPSNPPPQYTSKPHDAIFVMVRVLPPQATAAHSSGCCVAKWSPTRFRSSKLDSSNRARAREPQHSGYLHVHAQIDSFM
jgi:hypothetical protein